MALPLRLLYCDVCRYPSWAWAWGTLFAPLATPLLHPERHGGLLSIVLFHRLSGVGSSMCIDRFYAYLEWHLTLHLHKRYPLSQG
jgi:hypothetical protein